MCTLWGRLVFSLIPMFFTKYNLHMKRVKKNTYCIYLAVRFAMMSYFETFLVICGYLLLIFYLFKTIFYTWKCLEFSYNAKTKRYEFLLMFAFFRFRLATFLFCFKYRIMTSVQSKPRPATHVIINTPLIYIQCL